MSIKFLGAKNKDTPNSKVSTVVIVSKDYEKLEEKHQKALRDIEYARRELEKVKYEFELKLRETLETERQKTVNHSLH